VVELKLFTGIAKGLKPADNEEFLKMISLKISS